MADGTAMGCLPDEFPLSQRPSRLHKDQQPDKTVITPGPLQVRPGQPWAARPHRRFRAPDSLLIRLAPEAVEFAYRCAGHPGRSDWPFFHSAVREVWQALRPLL